MAVAQLDIQINSNVAAINALTKSLEKLTDGMQNATTAMQGASKVLEEVGRHSERVAVSARKAGTPIGKLLTKVLSIGKLMLIRQAVKAMFKAFTEGLDNAVAADRKINGQMAKSLDLLASASLNMKNNVGAAFGELLNTIQPILTTIIGWVIKFANVLSQLFAAFGGRSDWLKMDDGVAKWGESAKKSAKAAKEWKNQLMGFDEINRLNEPSSGSGGSGGSSSGGDGTGQRVELSGWAQWIKDNLETILPLVELIGTAILVGWAGGFSKTSIAIGLILGGLWLIYDPIKKMIDGVKLTDAEFGKLSLGIGAVGAGFALITGSWIPLLIAAIAIAVAWVINNWDDIKEFFIKLWQIIKEKFSDAWEFVKEKWGAAKTWFSETVITPLINGFNTMKTKLKEIWQSVKEFISNAMKAAANATISAFESALNWVIRKINGILDGINWIADLFGADTNLHIEEVSFQRFANGGFPNAGEMFIAREAGPEMVGSIGGHTAVANNDQIVEAVSRGVYEAVSSAMSNGNRAVNVYLDGKQISDSVTRYQRQSARAYGY